MENVLNRLHLFTLLLTLALTPPALATERVATLDKESLKNMLASAELILIDTRAPADWETSSAKIRGAVRGAAADFNHWGKRYPKEATIVLYCS